MKPECRHAQQAISEAYDGSGVSPSEMQAIKTHCSSCPECGRFVAGLAKLRSVATPEVPERVIAATMSAARQAADRMSAESMAVNAAPSPDVAPRPVTTLPRSFNRGSLAWMGAAAAIVLAVGIGTVWGVRYMLTPPVDISTETLERTMSAEENSAELVAPQADSPATDGRGSLSAPYEGDIRYVVFDGRVYLTSERTVTLSGRDVLAETALTDLGTGASTPRDVYDARDDETIVVGADEPGRGFEATLVTRELDGVTFALRSNRVDAFGTWPSLPPGFDTPMSEDGSPTFESAGQDDARTPIFVPPGRTPTDGFAVAPGTSGRDLLAGNPNWTWWEPYVP